MRLTLLEILEATKGGQVGGTLVGNAFTSFHTDSRDVQSGGAFFALRGAERDGHDFAKDAIERGASALVVERAQQPAPHGVAQVVVKNSWTALYDLAGYVLGRVRPLVVGITGSNGKTSTKEMAAAVLAQRYNVLRTSGNLNTETGVPLTILRLEPEHTALVVEMGMQRAGDIAKLVNLAHPSIGVITNIGVVHMEFFESREGLARAKGELVAGLPTTGLAVLNADEPFHPLLASLTAAKVVSFGLKAGDYRAEDYRPLPEGGCEFNVRGVPVRLALEGRHQALNALAALAAGEFAGVSLPAGARALAEVAVEHRLQELRTAGGVILVDDAYNASPESMLAAFETVAERPRAGRLLAVLGEMAELGTLADDSHRRVGERAGEVFDAVAVIDTPRGRILAEAAGAEVVPDRAAAVAWIRKHAKAGDRVLVKASRSRRLDEVVKELTG
jgi:UDP-N-acetylmuramoyl-tripeptide--D-alanyl-D-alanine ligase